MTFKIYLRPKANSNYTVFIQAIHNRKVKYIKNGFSLNSSQVNKNGEIKSREINQSLKKQIQVYEQKIAKLGTRVNYMTCEEVLDFIQREDKIEVQADRIDFYEFSYEYVEQLKNEGKRRGFDILIVLRSLQDYHPEKLPFSKINKEFILGYIDFLSTVRTLKRKDQFGRDTIQVSKRMSEATINDRLRIIRALINKAMYKYNTEEDEYIKNRVFKFIKIQSPKPKQKRAIPVDVIRQIFNYHSETDKRGQLARDLFIASFFLCGMNAIDFYNMEKNSYYDQKLCYQRSKTKDKRFDNAEIMVWIPDLVVPILQKYLDNKSKYLFVFRSEYSHPQTFSSILNSGLKRIAKAIGYEENLTFYAARHSFATIARNDCRIEKSTVAECLNHSQNTITDFYLVKDYTRIWDAQKIVYDYVLGNEL